MHVWHFELEKFVDSLTPEQQLCLGMHLHSDDTENTEQLKTLLRQRLSSKTPEEARAVLESTQKLFAVQKTTCT